MNLTAFFKTHRQLRKENTELKECNVRQKMRLMACEASIRRQFQLGYEAATQVQFSEQALLHREIQELNDLLQVK